jgi:hypothetical protein
VKEHQALPRATVPRSSTEAARRLIRPQMFTLVDLEQSQIDQISQAAPGGADNIQDIYPLSPLQEGLLFHYLLNEQSSTYVLSTLLELQSRVHLDRLEDALQKVIDRHDILRSGVAWSRLPRPVQIVYRRIQMGAEQVRLEGNRDPRSQLEAMITSRQRPWDLGRAPLMRLLWTADPESERCYALLQLHHVICDYGTLRRVVAETMAHLEGRAHELPLAMPYRDYIAEALTHAKENDAQAFFSSKLGDVEEPTAPFGITGVLGDGMAVTEVRETLDPGLARDLRSQAQQLGVSAARLFHAAWALVVAHTSGRDDVVFGTIVLARQQRTAGAQRALGLSINTLPLRLRLRGLSVRQLVNDTHREITELLRFEQTSLDVAQRCSRVAAPAPLFTTLLNYRHGASSLESQWSARGFQVLLEDEARTNYPVGLTIDSTSDGFLLTVQTDRRIDPHRLAAYMQTALHSLVRALVRAPETPALML